MFDVTVVSWSKVQAFHAKEVAIGDTVLVLVCCQVGTLFHFSSEIYLYEWILDTKSQNHRSVRIGRELWG